MTRVLIDESLRSKLNGLNEEMELCDESGRTLGHFLPPNVYRKLLYAYAESECPYSQEELKRMRQETGGRSLVEISKDSGRDELHRSIIAETMP